MLAMLLLYTCCIVEAVLRLCCWKDGDTGHNRRGLGNGAALQHRYTCTYHYDACRCKTSVHHGVHMFQLMAGFGSKWVGTLARVVSASRAWSLVPIQLLRYCVMVMSLPWVGGSAVGRVCRGALGCETRN
jgi:hypothetical protein